MVAPAAPLSIVYGPRLPRPLDTTLGQLLRNQAKIRSNRIALISQHQNELITYDDLNSRSDVLAQALFAFGIRKGDRVAVMLGNRSEYIDVSYSMLQYL
jgi:non-ribosomal peptide synthetase component E (peptide arylation enzyme)